MLREGSAGGGRTLDVACGVGRLTLGLHERGGEAWGLEPSQQMLGLGQWLFPGRDVVLVRGVAEALPFRAGSFDRVICQGSLDHFVEPLGFMREAARLLHPGGRVVITIGNYESLSCRLGRLRRSLERALFRRHAPSERPYWQMPPDHNHKGGPSFVRGLGGGALHLERWYGISLLWLVRGWGTWLDRLPRRLAYTLLGALDRVAYRAPVWADLIVSVWRPWPTEESTDAR